MVSEYAFGVLVRVPREVDVGDDGDDGDNGDADGDGGDNGDADGDDVVESQWTPPARRPERLF